MCEFSGKLMAWLDHELPADDAAGVERHLELCAECRGHVEAYRRAATAFEQYCDAYSDAVMASQPVRKLRRRVLKSWEGAALAAAALAAVFLFVARAHVQLSPAHAPAPVAGTPAVSRPIETANAVRPPLATDAPAEQTEQGALASEPALEIAIPADAILPPGAVPDGVSFDADVTIAPDGSAQQINLTPQLTEFERRSSQP
jgi:hypothetical protein